MLKTNEQVTIPGTELVDALKEIEIILISLHRMGSYYAIKYHEDKLKIDNAEYEKETTRFIDEWKVTHRLAKVRGILSDKFDNTLDVDDMDDIERAMEELRYWEKPGDCPVDI